MIMEPHFEKQCIYDRYLEVADVMSFLLSVTGKFKKNDIFLHDTEVLSVFLILCSKAQSIQRQIYQR